MEEPRQVELVRVPREEEYYDREQIFGRDVSSVFPNQQQDSNALDALKDAIGAKKFISETELEELKASRGLAVEDGTLAADKPLAEVLRERKEAKDAAFQEQWRMMKQGKNRPLDEEELAFYDTLYEQERAKLAAQAAEEEEALAAYRAAVTAAKVPDAEGDAEGTRAAVVTVADGGFDSLETSMPSSSQQQPQQQKSTGPSKGRGAAAGASLKRPAVVPLVKVRPRGSGQTGTNHGQQQQQQGPGGSQPEKRLRQGGEGGGQEEPAAEEGAVGLAGLLGYGSDGERYSQ